MPSELTHLLGPVDQTHLGPWSPIDAERRPTLGPPTPRQRIEERVRRGVVRLTRRTQHRGGRREQHEEVQVDVPGQRMQIPGAFDLWRHDVAQPALVEVGDDAVVEHSRRVHDPAEWRHGHADRLDHRRDVIRSGDVPARRHDVCPGAAQARRASAAPKPRGHCVPTGQGAERPARPARWRPHGQALRGRR